jgi:uncharacterized protein
MVRRSIVAALLAQSWVLRVVTIILSRTTLIVLSALELSSIGIPFLRHLLAMEWLGKAKIDFIHAESTMAIQENDGTRTDLAKIVEKTTPPCRLNPFLFNGHAQTMWTAVQQHGPPVYYKRKIFQADHKTYNGTFTVDFVVEPFKETDGSLPPRTVYYTEDELNAIGSDDTRPMLLVLHGLSGGSHEIYLRHAIAPLIEKGGWDICVLNSRGCAMSKITSGVLYNARATWDPRQTVKWLKEKFPNRSLFGLGFSLGANILTNVSLTLTPLPPVPFSNFDVQTDMTKYVAEEGSECLLKAAIVCGNPFNLDISNRNLQRKILGKSVYQRVMGSKSLPICSQTNPLS